MKTKLLTVAALAAIVSLSASCVRNKPGIDPGTREGEPTSISLSIATPVKPGTRNETADANGIPAESEVKKVDVFIYLAGNGFFSSHTELGAADFSQGSSTGSADVYNYTAQNKIATTTGPKMVYVGVNLPSAVVTAIGERTESEMLSAVYDMGNSDMFGIGGFVMFSVEGVLGDFVNEANPAKGTKNKITVDVERMVAKVTLETAQNFDTSNLPGTLGDLKFNIDNFNTQHYLIPKSPVQDPNHTWGEEGHTGDFEVLIYDTWKNISSGDEGDIAIDNYEAGYASENTSAGKTKKEVTRAVVRGTFIPAQITSGSAGNWTTAANPNPGTVATFYAVTPTVSSPTSFFLNQEAANAFAQEKDVTPITYADGYCYWDVFLGKNNAAPNKWDVLRNDYYQCVITKIVNMGRPGTDIPDPNVTPDNDADIEVDINVLFWHNKIRSTYEL